MYTYTKGDKVMAGKLRVNINVTQDQKNKMQQYADSKSITLTDYILKQCIMDPNNAGDSVAGQEVIELKETINALQDQIRALNEEVDRARFISDQAEQLQRIHRDQIRALTDDLEQWKQRHDLLQAKNDTLTQAVLWQSLPFWKKIGKRLELPNK